MAIGALMSGTKDSARTAMRADEFDRRHQPRRYFEEGCAHSVQNDAKPLRPLAELVAALPKKAEADDRSGRRKHPIGDGARSRERGQNRDKCSKIHVDCPFIGLAQFDRTRPQTCSIFGSLGLPLQSLGTVFLIAPPVASRNRPQNGSYSREVV